MSTPDRLKICDKAATMASGLDLSNQGVKVTHSPGGTLKDFAVVPNLVPVEIHLSIDGTNWRYAPRPSITPFELAQILPLVFCPSAPYSYRFDYKAFWEGLGSAQRHFKEMKE